MMVQDEVVRPVYRWPGILSVWTKTQYKQFLTTTPLTSCYWVMVTQITCRRMLPFAAI